MTDWWAKLWRSLGLRSYLREYPDRIARIEVLAFKFAAEPLHPMTTAYYHRRLREEIKQYQQWQRELNPGFVYYWMPDLEIKDE